MMPIKTFEHIGASDLTLIVPGDPNQRTGGYLYDARIVDGLHSMGWTVDVIGLAGRFPDADKAARRAMSDALDRLADGACVVIDGLGLGGVPNSVTDHSERLKLIGLVHHPLADETGLADKQRNTLLESERRALASCRAVIVTSPFTRRRLQELALIDEQPVHVVEPGVSRSPLARRVEERLRGAQPDGPMRLICVAHLSPRKGQNLLIQALARLSENNWTLDLVGSTEREPEFAKGIKELIRRYGLDDRIRLHGEVGEARLAELYDQSDLTLLPSWYEGYGMVVSEALARGLPMISSTGGALQDTVPAAAALRAAPGRIDELQQALETWMTNGELRMRLYQAAAEERCSLRDWPETVRRFAAALEASVDNACGTPR